MSAIELKNVSFNYDNSSKKILDDVNFTLKKNDFIGLVGNTGSGKTTFVDILARIFKTY